MTKEMLAQLKEKAESVPTLLVVEHPTKEDGGLIIPKLTNERCFIAYLGGPHACFTEEDATFVTEARGDILSLIAEVERLRHALHCISLDEYESTSSASEKVHGHARIARDALKWGAE